jgi:predicted nuclease of predicted toxin-antitoxin system
MIRYQADADLNGLILRATQRLEPALDFKSAGEAGLRGLPDPSVLAIAAEAGRILVTHDQRTMPGHFAEFLATRSSPGVIIVQQHLPVAAAAEELVLIWAGTQAEEWQNRIYWLRP